MNAMPHRAQFAFRKAGPPSPLLSFLAGGHAEAVARLWPAPHDGFLTLPTARRHAAAILLAGLSKDAAPDGETLVRWVARDKDAALAARLIGDRAPGFVKVLRKSGEQLWTDHGYQHLLGLYAEPLANRALRHMEAVNPDALAPLSALPAPLREAKIVAATPCVHAARDLARAYGFIGLLRGPKAQQNAVQAWARAADKAALMNSAVAWLVPGRFRTPEAAPVLPEPFKRVISFEQLVAVALEFRNCLRDFAADIANGRMAVYVWHGQPNAAVALTWDAAGWRLAEAEAASNTELDAGALRQIVDVVQRSGVRTGPSVRAVIDRLQRYAGSYGHPEIIGEGFVEQLELGDLWA